MLPRPLDRRARIVVLDDDRTYLQLLEELFRDEGYDVSVSSTWRTLAHVVQETPPDLIILDLVFDGQERGWALLDQLRRDPQTYSIPLLLCSAAVQALRRQEEWLRTLGVHTLAKPFDLNDFLL